MIKENLFVLKQTSSLGDLLIKPVAKELARQMVIEHHYSHKWNFGGFGVFNFGIFRADEPDKCLGVAVYGYMKNMNANIFHHPNPKAWMCELNRLWIDDCLGKNAETILIAASIKLIRKMDAKCRGDTKFCRRPFRLRNNLQGGQLQILRLSLHALSAQ